MLNYLIKYVESHSYTGRLVILTNTHVPGTFELCEPLLFMFVREGSQLDRTVQHVALFKLVTLVL